MELKPIPFNKFQLKRISLLDEQWLLLSAGDFARKEFNSMVISWGSLGVMWSKPFVQVVVRPTRYTYEFINKFPDFTLCAFPEEYRKVLNKLGSKSGREIDKITHSGLTPCPAELVAAPVYAEAELVLECRKMYWQDMNPANFLDEKITKCYTSDDYHRIYFGELLAVHGVDKFCSQA